MKLLNYTTAYFAGILLFVIAVWAGIFYFSMLREIYDSIDDGLDNQKGLVIQKAKTDSTILTQSNFDEKDYSISEISSSEAITNEDTYLDTSMYMQNEDDYEPVRLLRTDFIQNGRHYKLLVTTSMVEEDDLINQLLLSIIFLYLGLVIVILLLNNFLLKRIWKPFYQLLTQLKQYRIDRAKPVEMSKSRVEEFNLLYETIQRMLKTNAETFASQKQFIENASHELQTPLAISINKLESLVESKNLQPGQLSLVSSTLDSLERAKRLNKTLLLISQIENKQFHEVANVNISQLIEKILADFSDQIKYKNLELTLVSNQQCIVQMNGELARILLTNLIKNAIVHNNAGGILIVTIEKNSVLIKNTGENMPLDQGKIFTRFYKGKAGQSIGLGLSIAKSITSLYNFNIRYEFSNYHIIQLTFNNRD